MKTKEKSVEQYLRAEVEARGGVCIKLDPANNKGFPDRLVLLPGETIFVEVKKGRGGVVSPLQTMWAEKLASLGVRHLFVFGVADVKKVLEAYDALH